MVGEVAKVVKEKSGEGRVNLLQELLDAEVSRLAWGKASARIYASGFEGELSIDVKEVRVSADGRRLTIHVEGYDGGLVLSLSGGSGDP